MADPYYIASRTQLLSELRLSGASGATAPAAEIIDSAILAARRRIFVALGESRATTIEGYTYDENATDSEGITRLTANECERKIIKLELLRDLPNQFLEGNEGQKAWNDEGFLRELSTDQIDEETRRLESDIENLLAALCAPSEADEQGSVRVNVIGPEETNTYPGQDTIFPPITSL